MNKTESTEKHFDSKAEKYVDYALKHFEIGVDQNDKAFASLIDRMNRIAHPLHGKWMRKWLRRVAHGNGDLLRTDDLKASSKRGVLKQRRTHLPGDPIKPTAILP